MTLRTNNIAKLKKGTFDVLIIGGGINGAVSASALAGGGASTALIERDDFAGFTSQESSNLVWGGIKYLENFELGLVRNLCMSRNHLLKSYPSSIKEVRFFTSLERGFRHSRFTIFAAALFYWLIGNFSTKAPRLLSKSRIEHEEPAVNARVTQGGLEYSDAYLVDNDARFVFRFVRNAMDHGAIAANYVESLGSKREGDSWVTRVWDTESGKKFSIRSRVLINSCGPYVDEHNSLSGVTTKHHHLFSKGIHLLVKSLTKHRRVLTFFADDGRLFFVIPMGPNSCIGTTDTRVKTPEAFVTPEDREFVLSNINKRLNLKRPLSTRDIIAERCGVRPLVVTGKANQKDKGDWTSLSRKHAVEVKCEQRHISIFGGKLTDCLNVGEEIGDAVESMGIKLEFRNFRWYGEPTAVIRKEYFHQAHLTGLDELTAPESSELISSRLWRRYGAHALYLLEEIRQDPANAEVLIKGTEYIRCEIHHAARREMIVKLEDFLRRRSKIALIERADEIKRSPGLLEACRILFGKDAKKRFKEYFKSRK